MFCVRAGEDAGLHDMVDRQADEDAESPEAASLRRNRDRAGVGDVPGEYALRLGKGLRKLTAIPAAPSIDLPSPGPEALAVMAPLFTTEPVKVPPVEVLFAIAVVPPRPMSFPPP